MTDTVIRPALQAGSIEPGGAAVAGLVGQFRRSRLSR